MFFRFCKASPISPGTSSKPSSSSIFSNGYSSSTLLSNGYASASPLSNGSLAQSLSNGNSERSDPIGEKDPVQETGVLQAESNGDLDKEDKLNGDDKKRSSRVNQCASFIPNESASDELESENEKIGRKYSYVSVCTFLPVNDEKSMSNV